MSLFEKLVSSDIDEVLSGLYELGSSEKVEIFPELLRLLIRLVSHEDAEVRLEVAAAVGIRLRRIEFFNALFLRLAEQELDESVLCVLMDATTAIALHKDVNRKDLAKVLASHVLDTELEDETRGTAYLCLLKLLGKISPQDYAKSPSELSKISWDRTFVDGIIQK